MDWIIITLIVMVVLLLIFAAHYDGYMRGYKTGFNHGKFAINNFLLKTNHALGERVEEMNSRK